MEVYGLHDTWDMFMSDEEKESWISNDMREAEYMDAYHDEFDDYDANTAY